MPIGIYNIPIRRIDCTQFTLKYTNLYVSFAIQNTGASIS